MNVINIFARNKASILFAAFAIALGVFVIAANKTHAQDDSGFGGSYYDDSAYSSGGTGYSDNAYSGGTYYDDSTYGGTGYSDAAYGSTGTYYDDSAYTGGTGTYYDYTNCGSSCGGTYYDDTQNTANGTYYDDTTCGTSCGGTYYDDQLTNCNTCTTQNGVTYSTEYGNGTSYSTEYSPGYTSTSCASCSRPFSIPAPTSFPIPPSYYPTPLPHPIPTPVPIPVPQPIPQPVPQPIVIPQPANNTCTNGSCNYTNNSVNNSGNTVTVLPVAQAPVTYPVQYTFPQPVPNYQNLTCAITASPNQVQAGQYAYLQWQSSGAVSATLSGYGNVAPSGSLSIRPTGSQNYILTVYGQNGQTTTCNTLVTIGSAPRYPSVTLSQIPYTGFDFGPLGDAMYWVALAVFALASGYLLVYYKGGMAAFAGLMPRRAPRAVTPAAQPVIATPVAPVAEVVAKPAAPVLPTLATGARPTSDSMKVAFTDGAPRIVISRN